MERIDAHQHFWNYDAQRHSWITNDMAVIRRDFLPQDLEPVLKENSIDGTVAVQADQTEEETLFLLELSNKCDFIKGVVGWVDLQSGDIAEKLGSLKKNKKLKGFRHVLQSEPEDDFMLRPAFLNGIAELGKHEFTFDILVFPKHLIHLETLVKKFPAQRFVIDHIAKPDIKNREIKDWEKNMRVIAAYSNIYCKISGMVTEADWENWKKDDFYPYLDVIMKSFGPERLMFGSDWPVCLVAASYEHVAGLINDYSSALSGDEQKLIFGGNAIKFYDLNP